MGYAEYIEVEDDAMNHDESDRIEDIFIILAVRKKALEQKIAARSEQNNFLEKCLKKPAYEKDV